MINSRYIVYYFAGIISALSFITIHRLIINNQTNQLKYGHERRKKAVFFGDSITQHGSNTSTHGWVAKFTEWWFRKVDVINRGFSGYNTKWGLLVIDAIIAEDPDILLIFFGANDAVDERLKQHVSPTNYQNNLQRMIQIFHNKLPKTKLMIITPPPVDEGKLEQMNRLKGKEVLVDRTNERALTYATICKKLGNQYNIPVVDVWSSLGGYSSIRADYLSDGLHLNELGNNKVFETVRDVIIRNYPEWIPEAMSMHMLEWAAMIELENAGKI